MNTTKTHTLILCVLLIALVQSSCSKPKSHSEIYFDLDFPKSEQLTAKALSAIDQLLPQKICVFDSIIMVKDFEQNPAFHFYNKNTYKKIGVYGYRGNGPSEFINPDCNCQMFSDGERKTIMLTEFNYGKLYEVDLNKVLFKAKNSVDSLIGDDSEIISKAFLKSEVIPSDNMYWDGNKLFGESISESYDYKYFLSNKNNLDSVIPKGEFVETSFLKTVDPSDLDNFRRSYLGFSTSQQKFIAAYVLLNRMHILDANLNLEKVIYYGNKEKKPISNKLYRVSGHIKHFRTNPYMGKNSFYVLYSGAASESEPGFFNEIHEFDYNGNPIKKYTLSQPTVDFTIDEQDQIIYATTGLDDVPMVTYKFNR